MATRLRRIASGTSGLYSRANDAALALTGPPRTHIDTIQAMTDLKLIALDAEDLDIISAHVQDAVLKVGEMAWLPQERRFAAIVNRFDWLSALPEGRRRARLQRRRTALRFERVSAARLMAIDVAAKDRVLALLAIQFEPRIAPAGAVTLLFAGGAAIRLDVDCIEAELRDLGAVWSARAKPDHSAGSSESEPGSG